ncbi:MAG TPA: hypothetical protein VLW53_13035, partial [Candidatus Eisenbacteria bacterium]|nr:hypothetical protein [Candidatus Eisenbacteria bacterium]
RDVDLDSARGLIERGPRACLSFACSHGPQAQPVLLVAHDGRWLAGIPEDAGHRPRVGQEVVLLADAGVHYFDLRALSIRGRLGPAAAPPGAPAGRTWFEVVPLAAAAWDYGSMREVGDET